MSYLYQSSTQRRLSYLAAPGTILSGMESSYRTDSSILSASTEIAARLSYLIATTLSYHRSTSAMLSYQSRSHLIVRTILSTDDVISYQRSTSATLSYHARSHLIDSILSASYRDYLISREAILSSSYQRDCRDYKAILSSAAVSYQHRDAILSADIHDPGATESILSAAEPSHHQASDPQQSSYLASQ